MRKTQGLHCQNSKIFNGFTGEKSYDLIITGA